MENKEALRQEITKLGDLAEGLLRNAWDTALDGDMLSEYADDIESARKRALALLDGEATS